MEKKFQLLNRLDKDDDLLANSSNNTPGLLKGEWRSAIEKIVREKREKEIFIHLNKGRITQDSATKIKAKFEPWRDTLCALALKFEEIKNCLNGGYTLRTELTKGTIDTARERLQRELVQHPELTFVVKAVSERLQKLREVEGLRTRDFANLLNITNGNHPELIMTLWSKTRSLPGWPNSPDELNQEILLRQKVEAILPQVENVDPSLAAKTRDQLENERKLRWLSCLNQTIRSGGNFGSVIDKKEAFSIQNAELPPNVQYNLMLYEFKKNIEDIDDEDSAQVERLCTKFCRSISFSFFLKLKEIRDFYTELTEEVHEDNKSSTNPFLKLRTGDRHSHG